MKKILMLLTLASLVSFSVPTYAKGHVTMCSYLPCWFFSVNYDPMPRVSTDHDYKTIVGSDDHGNEFIQVWATIDKSGAIANSQMYQINPSIPLSMVCTLYNTVNNFAIAKAKVNNFASGELMTVGIDYSNPSLCRYIYVGPGRTF